MQLSALTQLMDCKLLGNPIDETSLPLSIQRLHERVCTTFYVCECHVQIRNDNLWQERLLLLKEDRRKAVRRALNIRQAVLTRVQVHHTS